MHSQNNLGDIVKSNFLLFTLCLISLPLLVIVPPDNQYLTYFDKLTLLTLFSLMVIVAVLEKEGILKNIAQLIISYFKTFRGLALGLVFGTGITSMIVSNDVALLTFLPLTYLALKELNRLDFLAVLFILETIAANLIGMITPFGSPQNLFLYSFYELSIIEFLKVLIIPFLASLIIITLITVVCFQNERIGTFKKPDYFKLADGVFYLILFLIVVLTIFRVLPIWTSLSVPLLILIFNRRAFLNVDYGLFLTFILFFIITGNIARIDLFNNFISNLDNVLLTSVATSQIISNVPSAILLANFTTNSSALLAGVNIGGVGMITASLANIIALVKYREYQPQKTKKFLLLFFLINISILIILYLIMQLAFKTFLS
jgi:Na+/H+ antiporter NhaD/arsenite permease-like protein